MISAVNFAIVIGQLLGYGVMRETQAIDSSMSYRIIDWNPWIQMSRRRWKKSELTHNAAAAPSEASGFATLKECFNAKNRLRTTISLSVFFPQASSGVAWVVAYMGYFLQLSDMEGTSVFDATVGIAGAMPFGTMASWWAVERIGRRWTILGVLALFVNSGRQVVLTQVGFMALWAFMYQASIGSAGYSLVSEVPTSHLRGAVQSMATMVNGASNAVWALSLPYMINPDQANMGGRSFEEIDALFDRGVSPRHFASTKLD
ncbi:hypothetical protein P171DRAFT_480643 [Karstenula rhodostoma CBS 690.94]|uniref:Major facilitator superfamily (MFS) profile domain-containing protein n=1 Tax=Karstenula rhodostoma CBS 690.94 TaxID=1392251 RepID=A0A9P4PVA1_9PLEO|nr:hypothetical protein P171DRAFT_480643 [Karstenula rhodostoma CBS 690.94]